MRGGLGVGQLFNHRRRGVDHHAGMDRQRIDVLEPQDRLLLAVLPHPELVGGEIGDWPAALVEHRSEELDQIDLDRFGAAFDAEQPPKSCSTAARIASRSA